MARQQAYKLAKAVNDGSTENKLKFACRNKRNLLFDKGLQINTGLNYLIKCSF
jgi:hypothetical protein